MMAKKETFDLLNIGAGLAFIKPTQRRKKKITISVARTFSATRVKEYKKRTTRIIIIIRI